MCFGSKRFFEQPRNNVELNVKQRRDRADVRNILHQYSCANPVEMFVTHSREWNTDDRNIVTTQQAVARPGGIVNQPAAGFNLGHVPYIRLRIHRNHDVNAIRSRLVTITRHTNFVPGR